MLLIIFEGKIRAAYIVVYDCYEGTWDVYIDRWHIKTFFAYEKN